MADWARKTVDVAIEEREVEMSDLASDFPVEVKSYYTDQATFFEDYPTFEATNMKPYKMRRIVYTVTGTIQGPTKNFRNNFLDNYVTTAEVTPPTMKIADGIGGAIPSGKYFVQNVSIDDQQNGMSTVSGTWKREEAFVKVQKAET